MNHAIDNGGDHPEAPALPLTTTARVITAAVFEESLSEIVLELNGWRAECIAENNSGLQSQTKKLVNEIVVKFCRGNVKANTATSILEEALDVPCCNLVLKFDQSSNVSCLIESLYRAKMDISNFLSILKRYPKFLFEEEMETCTLYLPKSFQVNTVHFGGSINALKPRVCLEACEQHHQINALIDNVVPTIVQEEIYEQQFDVLEFEENVSYFPPELVSFCSNNRETTYHCYIIGMECDYHYDIPFQNILLLLRKELDRDVVNFIFNLEDERGHVSVNIKYVGSIELRPDHVILCRNFQSIIFSFLMDRTFNGLKEVMQEINVKNEKEVHERNGEGIDYILLPTTSSNKRIYGIDWDSIRKFVLLSYDYVGCHANFCPLKSHARNVQTKSGFVCNCVLQNSLVYTPHNDLVYIVDGFLDDLNGNSLLSDRKGKKITYENYYKSRYGIELHHLHESLLKGRPIFHIKNYLHRGRIRSNKEEKSKFIELPPELCCIIKSPISISTLYSFSYLPTIMHQIESLLIATNLKVHLGMGTQNVDIPTTKVLEAITTKKCQEDFNLESFEFIGDSFLKYSTCQQLFKIYQNLHEGALTKKKVKIISNASLWKLGCDHKLPGFIRDDSFHPENWIFPGKLSKTCLSADQMASPLRKIYVKGTRKIQRKTVADVVEALLGAFLSTAGEQAAISFMNWLGIQVDFAFIPYKRHLTLHPERLPNIDQLQSLLNYKFRDPSLLVEALTHGSYTQLEITRCYKRLEFLGDAVLDYLMTMRLYREYPGSSPGLLTDLRSASVSNYCYARSAVRAGLHRHILRFSMNLDKRIYKAVHEFEQLPSDSTFGWEYETSFPKVLGDVIESLAGAIFIDSTCNTEIVFKSIRPLLEPLVTPDTFNPSLPKEKGMK